MSAIPQGIISCQSAGRVATLTKLPMCTSLAIFRSTCAPLNTHLLDFAKCRKKMLNCVKNRWSEKLSKSDILAEL